MKRDTLVDCAQTLRTLSLCRFQDKWSYLYPEPQLHFATILATIAFRVYEVDYTFSVMHVLIRTVHDILLRTLS